MDHNDRSAIQGLFDKLSHARQAQPDRDPEAEALIAELMTRNPGAAYYLAQTVIMQEQALRQAEAQMRPAPAPEQPSSGGFLGRLFGNEPPRQPTAQPAPRPQSSGPWSSGRPSSGGGFMAGAAQTAMGVAGGMLLGNAIGGMFAGPADAGELTQDPAVEDMAAEDMAAYDDPGLQDEDFGGFE